MDPPNYGNSASAPAAGASSKSGKDKKPKKTYEEGDSKKKFVSILHFGISPSCETISCRVSANLNVKRIPLTSNDLLATGLLSLEVNVRLKPCLFTTLTACSHSILLLNTDTLGTKHCQAFPTC